MRIKVKDLPYEQAALLPAAEHVFPRKPALFFRFLLKALSAPELKAVAFRCERVGMERLGRDEPTLFLMNHSSFIDLKIASSILFPRPFNIVCTSDGFVGKERLMRSLGCIPARKFMTDTTLVRDMLYALDALKSSVLMYPEASYSFDGTATPLPESLGKCLKLLRVPVVMIRTYGAFARDPLYNGLRVRKTQVRAKMEYILSPEDIQAKTPAELNDILRRHFTFDNFRWQQENNVLITEAFRAEGLNRVLYKCPCCNAEGEMHGAGIQLKCARCGAEWELTERGALRRINGESFFTHVPDWYAWERACVRQELESGSYSLDLPVDICMQIDMKCIYRVGAGRLTHGPGGFRLTGCGGRLDVSQAPTASYSLYSDYFWYELGDMICIGDRKALYYCFPQTSGDVVAKTRLAAEELYKLRKPQRAVSIG